jgi:hypothetical protein
LKSAKIVSPRVRTRCSLVGVLPRVKSEVLVEEFLP